MEWMDMNGWLGRWMVGWMYEMTRWMGRWMERLTLTWPLDFCGNACMQSSAFDLRTSKTLNFLPSFAVESLCVLRKPCF